jgi:ABC-2 type transport system permease protein
VFLEQLRGAVMGAPLPLSESLMIAWPQTVGLIAGTILLFGTATCCFSGRR